MESVIQLLFMIVAVGFVVWLYFFLPADMAKRRGRSALIWILIAIFGSPILAVLLLAALGDAPTKTETSERLTPGRETGPWDKGGKA